MKAGPGRPKGSKNKLTGAHSDLLAAWDKGGGPKTALEIMKAAINEAVDNHNFEPLAKILPFIARKLDNTMVGPEGEEEGKTVEVTLKLSE